MEPLLVTENQQLKLLLNFVVKLNDLLLKYRHQNNHLLALRKECYCVDSGHIEPLEQLYLSVVREADQIDLSGLVTASTDESSVTDIINDWVDSRLDDKRQVNRVNEEPESNDRFILPDAGFDIVDEGPDKDPDFDPDFGKSKEPRKRGRPRKYPVEEKLPKKKKPPEAEEPEKVKKISKEKTQPKKKNPPEVEKPEKVTDKKEKVKKQPKLKKLAKEKKPPKVKKAKVIRTWKPEMDPSQFKQNVQGQYIGLHRPAKIHQKGWICDQPNCSFVGQRMRDLEEHLPSHSASVARWYHCEVCSKRHSSRHRLQKHIREKHKEKTISCDEPGCDKMFATLSRMQIHKKSVHHTDVVWLECVWPGCEARFRTQISFDKHQLLHSGKKPWACHWPGCEFRTHGKDRLSVHLRRIHKRVRNYKCPWPGCDRDFFRKERMEMHQRQHTKQKEFTCQDCGRVFMLEFNFNKHLETKINCKKKAVKSKEIVQDDDDESNDTAIDETTIETSQLMDVIVSDSTFI